MKLFSGRVIFPCRSVNSSHDCEDSAGQITLISMKFEQSACNLVVLILSNNQSQSYGRARCKDPCN